MENKKTNYFTNLSKVKCEVEQKNNLNYISWASAWSELKTIHPEANYIIYENQEGNAFFKSEFGLDVKVGVKVGEIEHIIRLPVLDFKNKSMKENVTSFDINKSIMRALTKAIAMHGIGLYVYMGEDLPSLDWEKEFENCENIKDLQKMWFSSPKTKELEIVKNRIKDSFLINEEKLINKQIELKEKYDDLIK